MNSRTRLHSLHAIRGWAALFVVIAHAKYPFWSGGTAYLENYPVHTWEWWQYPLFAIDMMTSFASMFVIMFFVLSGFFITRSISIKKYTPVFFYGDRAIRIYIPYLGSLLVSYLALTYAQIVNPDLFLLDAPERPYNRDLIGAFQNLAWITFEKGLIFIPHNGMFFGYNYPYWSLFHEMLFYIFIPFILLFVRRFYFFAAALGLHVVSFFVETRWLSVGEFFLEYMVYFATGVLLYELISVRNKRVWLLKFIRKYTNLLIFLSFLFLLVSVPLGILKFTKFGYSFSMSATVMMMMWILYGRRSQLYLRVSNIIINKFSNFLGKISFSMYLVHVPILALMYATLSIVTNQLVYYNRIYWLAVVLIVPVSYLFYLVFEKSSLILLAKYKRKFKRRT